jgi:ABC-type transport system involved in multi-copper enzyme maturation permease subunit
MRQFLSIAYNTFMELVRQPIFLLLMTSSSGFCVFIAAVPYFGFGEDPKLVKDMSLALMLLSGLFGAVLCASSSVAQEIRLGTALTVLSKPVSRVTFLLGKYVGLAASLALMTYANLVAALLAGRMAFDAYGDTDVRSLSLYAGAVLLAYAVAGFFNFFLRRGFVSDAVFAHILFTSLTVMGIHLFIRDERSFGEVANVDWRMVPAAVLILFALLILAAAALACSTRLDTVPTLAVCSGLFLAGLMSDYFFKSAADSGAIWARFLYALTPNWQQFWLADALEDKKSIPWSYVARSAVYMASCLVAALSAGIWLFEDRELN